MPEKEMDGWLFLGTVPFSWCPKCIFLGLQIHFLCAQKEFFWGPKSILMRHNCKNIFHLFYYLIPFSLVCVILQLIGLKNSSLFQIVYLVDKVI